MLCAPVKNHGWGDQLASWSELWTGPQRSAQVPQSQACPSFSCLTTSVPIRIQHFNNKDTANFDG